MQHRTPFITALMRIPELQARLGPRWRELRAGALASSAVTLRLDALRLPLERAAVQDNFTLWPIAEVDFSQIYPPYSIYPVASYEEEDQRLRSWISARLSWLDAHIDSYPN